MEDVQRGLVEERSRWRIPPAGASCEEEWQNQQLGEQQVQKLIPADPSLAVRHSSGAAASG